MTTRRNTWRHELTHLIPLSWPVALSMLSYALMTLVDTLFVSQLGAPVLAGVGLAGVVYFTLLAFPAGALRAVKTVVAQRTGAGRTAEPAARAAVWIALVLAALFSVLCWALLPLLPRFLQSAEAGATAVGYLTVRVWAVPFDCVFMALREYRYGTGDTRAPMRATLVANAVNVGLDALFVPVLGLGAEGAAAATVTAALAQAVFLVVPTRAALRVRARGIATTILRLGGPSGVQFLIETGSFFALTVILARHSDRAVAAHQVALQLVHFGFLPAVAIGEAASVRAGAVVGAGRFRSVYAVTTASLMLVWAWAAATGLLFALGGGHIASWFGDDVAMLDEARVLLLVAAVLLLPDGAHIVLRGVLRGTGDVTVPAVLSVAGAWLITPPLALWWALHLDLGARGAWFALFVEILVANVTLGWRLRSRGWVAPARVSRRWSMDADSA